MKCQIVVVLGMHRSGTSAVAKYLVSLGCALPSESLAAHAKDNPDGYFEPRQMVNINNRILKTLGLNWQSIEPIASADFDKTELQPLKEEIDQYLAQVCQDGTTLVLKDPRLCRLLPIWWPALQRHAGSVLAVNVLRQPQSVAESLERRGQQPELAGAAISSFHHSTLLWLRYNLDAHKCLKALKPPCYTLSYEELSTSKRAQTKLTRWLGVNLSSFNPSMQTKEKSLRPARDLKPTDSYQDRDWKRLLEATYNQLSTSIKQDQGWLDKLDALISISIPSASQAKQGAPTPPIELRSRAIIKHASGQLENPISTIPVTVLGSLEANVLRLRARLMSRHNPTAGFGFPAYLFISENPSSRSHIYRVKNPVDALNRQGNSAGWMSPAAALAAPHNISAAKILVVHRCQWSDTLAELYRRARQAGTPIIYDIDDRVFEPELIEQGYIDFINRLTPERQTQWQETFNRYRQALTAADSALVPTPAIQAAVEALGVKCTIKPNGLSPETLELSQYWASVQQEARQQSQSGSANAIKRLGYASGTATHQADFETISEPLIGFLLENPLWQLTIIGSLETKALEQRLNPGQLERRPLVDHINLSYELARLDACLAPLEPDNPFCAGKSPLKWFEAAVCKVPALATNVGAFHHWISPSDDGLLATTSDQWQANLAQLENCADLIKIMAQTAERRVEQELNEGALVERWIQDLQREFLAMARKGRVR